MVKFIKLTQQKIAIVDDDRYDALMKFKWRAVRKRGGWYAKTTIYKNGNRIDISMHRFIAKTPYGMVTHHDNRNTLDNRSFNLINMSKEGHDLYHCNDTIKIKFAPVTANPGQLSLSQTDSEQE